MLKYVKRRSFLDLLFAFYQKIYYICVMALNIKEKINKKDSKVSFTEEEVVYLLELIKKSKFKGEDVQLVYEIAVKLTLLHNIFTNN